MIDRWNVSRRVKACSWLTEACGVFGAGSGGMVVLTGIGGSGEKF